MATDIVIDNLLCFLSNKIDTMTTDVLVRLCVTTYDEDEIRKSRDTLYELCESAGRMVKRQGPKMKEQTIEDVIKIMHEKGHEMPKFAAHDLSRLPPVSFDSIDVSALLHRMERTATEVHLLKDALSQQVKVNEDLHSAISSMQIRLDDLEKRKNDNRNSDIAGSFLRANAPPAEDPDITLAKAIFDTATTVEINESAKPNQNPEPLTAATGTTLFSELASKLGEWQVQRHKQNNKRKPQGIKGTAKSELKIVKPKRLANVFASRFDPQVTEDQLKNYLEKQTSLTVEVEKVQTKFDTYSSFHIKCRCENPQIFMDENIWPEEAYVRWWRESKQKDATGLAVLTNTSEDK